MKAHTVSAQRGEGSRWAAFGICAALVAITGLAFGGTIRHGFVNFDDNAYVYDNPVVRKGLTREGFQWALAYGGIGHWHPLTWLSHMLDCQLWGLSAGGHHLTSVLLHCAAVIMLFLVLREMTGRVWPSAFTAAVFAVHPLRVESVAWISERKDVLSASFFTMILGAYVRYSRSPSIMRYGVVMALLAMGLLSKSMLVTVPFVLLLLDYWPLRRLRISDGGTARRLIAEKIPLLALSLGACVTTLLSTEKMEPSAALPLTIRIENAVVSCAIYLWQMICPLRLACFYPNPVNHLPLWQIMTAAALLSAISAGVCLSRKSHPYFVTGWFWYLGMMAPVLGLAQISTYAHADRYTYLPQIGLYLMASWAAADWLAARMCRGWLPGALAASILIPLMLCARNQAESWRDSEALWTRALACTSGNDRAHTNLGMAFVAAGKMDAAAAQFHEALRINPDAAEAHNNLGNVLLQTGKTGDAVTHYERALSITPGLAETHNNLGSALLKMGRVDEAIHHCKEALRLKPRLAEAHNNLGKAFYHKGRADEEMREYERALEIEPSSLELQNNLALVLATSAQPSLRNGQRALELAEQANRTSGGRHPVVLRTLAAALAETGRFPEAVEAARRAWQATQSQGNTTLARMLETEIRLYQAGFPFHEASNPPR